jgi:hypothetical protein
MSGCKSPRGHPIPLIPQRRRATGISVTRNHDGPALRAGAGYGGATPRGRRLPAGLGAGLRVACRPVLSLSAATARHDKDSGGQDPYTLGPREGAGAGGSGSIDVRGLPVIVPGGI